MFAETVSRCDGRTESPVSDWDPRGCRGRCRTRDLPLFYVLFATSSDGTVVAGAGTSTNVPTARSPRPPARRRFVRALSSPCCAGGGGGSRHASPFPDRHQHSAVPRQPARSGAARARRRGDRAGRGARQGAPGERAAGEHPAPPHHAVRRGRRAARAAARRGGLRLPRHRLRRPHPPLADPGGTAVGQADALLGRRARARQRAEPPLASPRPADPADAPGDRHHRPRRAAHRRLLRRRAR
jgi:hypothetical protein